MSENFISRKNFYDVPLGDDKPVCPEMQQDCYAVFSCRHKFCRDVCPVFLEHRDESATSYGFHSAILSMAQGEGKLSEMTDIIQYCLECGACDLRCPNTLFTGDFYGLTTTNGDLVRKIRRDLIAQETPPTNWEDVEKYIQQDVEREKASTDEITKWAVDLNLPFFGDIILFVDYFNSFQTTDVPRNAAKILKKAGVNFGILEKPFPTMGEIYDSNLKMWIDYGKKNIEALSSAGAKKVIFVNPHDYMFFVREYPKYIDVPFDCCYITDYLYELIKDKKIILKNEVSINATYHDPCTLNKLTLSWESPRKIITALPGITFKVDSHVTQWDYCCGNGVNSFKRLLPDVSYKIGLKRFSQAEELGIEKLIVACPHCMDQLTEVQQKSGGSVEPVHVLDLIMQSMGLE